VITTAVLEYGSRQYSLEVVLVESRRRLRVRLDGKVIHDVPVSECGADGDLLAIIAQIDATEAAHLGKKEEFRHRGEDYLVEAWPVGRGFRTRVQNMGVVISEVTWDDYGSFEDVDEAFAWVKGEVLAGKIRRDYGQTERDFFPR